MCSLRCPVLLGKMCQEGRKMVDPNLWGFSRCGFPAGVGTQCSQPCEFETMGALRKPGALDSCIFLFLFFFFCFLNLFWSL